MSEENQDIESVADDESTKDLPDLPSPGQILKAIREEKGLSHARVAQALHMTAHYVNALETSQFEKLPGKTFIKGYFRAYAKLLGADVENISTCYDQYMAKLEENEISEANVIRARKAYDQNLRWMICAALIIIIVIGVSWWLAKGDDSQASVILAMAVSKLQTYSQG
jgi:cytoskeleton protein RodZ